MMSWKICPFCGSEDTGLTNGALDGLDYYRVACHTCFTEGPLAETVKEAIKKWNTRRRKPVRGGGGVE